MTGNKTPAKGEVWWVNFNPSVGSEIQKARPAVVVSNDKANTHLDRFQVVPLTTQIDRLYPGEAQVVVNDQQGKAMTNQLTTCSIERLGRRLGKLNQSDLNGVEGALRIQLGL